MYPYGHTHEGSWNDKHLVSIFHWTECFATANTDNNNNTSITEKKFHFRNKLLKNLLKQSAHALKLNMSMEPLLILFVSQQQFFLQYNLYY